MVQHSELEAAGVQPSEHSPLLAKPVDSNGQGGVSLSVAEVPAEEPLIGSQGNGSTVLKVGAGDEESQHQAEAEQQARKGHVARIISVLLIGTSLLLIK